MDNPWRTAFDNGLVLWTYQRPGRDAAIELTTPYGSYYDTPNAHFLEHMVFKSNRHRTAQALLFELDGKGISVQASVYGDRMNFYARVPAIHTVTALERLYEGFTNDCFDPAEVETEKEVIVGEVLNRQNPYELAQRRFREALYPAGHPMLVRETVDAVSAVTPAGLVASKQRFFGPHNASLAVVGDVPHDAIVAQVAGTFGALEKRGPENYTVPPVEPKKLEYRAEVDGIGSVAMYVRVPAVGFDHPDSSTFAFVQHLLGGSHGEYQFANRLTQELREKRGLVYGTEATYTRNKGFGALILSAAGMRARNAPAVRQILLDQLDRLKRDGISEEELRRAKDSLLVGVYRSDYETNGALADTLCYTEFQGQPWTFAHAERMVESVTPGDIRALANRYFDSRYATLLFMPTGTTA